MREGTDKEDDVSLVWVENRWAPSLSVCVCVCHHGRR